MGKPGPVRFPTLDKARDLWSAWTVVSETGLGATRRPREIRISEPGPNTSRRLFLQRNAVRTRSETSAAHARRLEDAEWLRFHRGGTVPLRPRQGVRSAFSNSIRRHENVPRRRHPRKS